MASEIKIGSATYRIGKKLSAMEQFHVTRRLGPALIICGVSFKMMLDGIDVPMENWMAVAGPVMEVVSRMSDEDVEYVIFTCMSVCERAQGGAGWAPVLAPGGRTMMFADMDQAEMIRLTIEVLRGNLENFAKGMFVDGNSTDESAVTDHPQGTRP